MSIKKLIAYITAIAILVLSCNITAFAADKPTATIGATVCSGTTMTGSYTYTGSVDEGNSIYRWYASDSFFDKGTLVTGADELTFNVGKETVGQFLTFAVVPVDINGTAGDEVCADPIMQNQGYYEDFASGMADNISSTVTADGYVEIQDDPAGSADKVLAVSKEHDSSFKTEARISFDSIMSSKSVVDVQLYASDIEGIAKIFGVYCDTYGSVLELQTDSTGALYYRGEGELKKSAADFAQDVWNHVVIEIDGDAKTVAATINGVDIIDGGAIKWRFDNESYNNVATSFINYGNGGKVYIKNLSVINTDGSKAAEADAESLEEIIPVETVSAITLPDKGSNGSSIFWKTSMPQYITADGQVTRPAYGEGDAEVILTAYVINGSYLVKKDIVVTVLEATLPPVAENIAITQNASRYVIASYDYYDENDEKEKDSILQWYVEQDGKYVPVEGANELVFVPTRDFDGKNIKFSVTPNNAVGIIGVETFSEPYKYVYYETQKPVVTITNKAVNSDGAFEFTCKYVSPDYVEEGDTIIKWYISDTLFGEYSVLEGANDKIYAPANKAAYYKFSITPVDIDGNAGDEVAFGPFMYTTSTNQLAAAEGAVADVILPESTYKDLELPLTTEDGASYTWVSANPEIIGNDGKITRPAADGQDATVTLTAYAVCGFEIASAEFTVIVNKYTTAPVITDQKLYQESRPIKLDFVYSDADENAMGEMVYEWYYKADADSDFVLIEGADSNMYAPAKEMDGYIFIAKITPVDDSHTAGEQVTTPEYTYVYQTPAKPSAEMKTTQLTALALTGDYEYINPDGIPEGDSEYSWYVASKLFGDYKQIAGANGKTFSYDSSYNGKYVKFVVVPRDAEGIEGDAVEAKPVLLTFNDAETFDADYQISDNIDTSSLAGGTVSIAADPAGNADNTALKLQRTSTTSGEMSMIKYLVPDYTGASGLIIEADLYASSDLKGTWEMFYICGSGVSQAYKLWVNGTNLCSRGGAYTAPDGTVTADSTMTIAKNFTKDTWHHVKVVVDMTTQMMLECSLNGVVLQTDMPFRNSQSRIAEIDSYIQNSITGTGYIDNIQITPIYASAAGGLAEADARAIDLGVDPDAVISNLRLPAVGSVNGSAITWTTSDETVITARGKVTRPESEAGDKKATLTAHVIKGNEYVTRDFELNVMRILNDDEIVEYDIAALASYDGILVDKDISLPSKGIYGATYSWVSSDEAAISNTGKVTLSDEKKTVTFDVTATYGDFTGTKQVTVTVVPVTGENLVINGGIDATSAKAQYQSANAGDGDYSTYWSSLAVDATPYVTLDMGKVKDVNQLYIADAAKTIKSLTISASKDTSTWEQVDIINGYDGDVVCTVEFEKVSARYIRVSFTGDGEICANELMLLYEETDSDKVTNGVDDITLPVSGNVTSNFAVTTALADGTKVEWTSSNTSVISFSGSTAVVTRGAYDTSVTLTATITSGSETATKSFIVVVSGTGSSGGGNGGGGSSGGGMSLGGGNTGGGVTSAVGSNVPAITPDVAATAFADIASVPWAVDAINELASIGVVNGTSATTFEPARSITREEFAAILYRGFGFDRVAVSGSFSDVKSDAWYYDCVMQLSSMGIISGMGDGSFGTGNTITRQDMAVMIYRAAKAANAQFTAAGADFADAEKIGSYAKDAVDALSGAQIINGVGNDCFNPAGNATRAEATVILARIMDYIR